MAQNAAFSSLQFLQSFTFLFDLPARVSCFLQFLLGLFLRTLRRFCIFYVSQGIMTWAFGFWVHFYSPFRPFEEPSLQLPISGPFAEMPLDFLTMLEPFPDPIDFISLSHTSRTLSRLFNRRKINLLNPILQTLHTEVLTKGVFRRYFWHHVHLYFQENHSPFSYLHSVAQCIRRKCDATEFNKLATDAASFSGFPPHSASNSKMRIYLTQLAVNLDLHPCLKNCLHARFRELKDFESIVNLAVLKFHNFGFLMFLVFELPLLSTSNTASVSSDRPNNLILKELCFFAIMFLMIFLLFWIPRKTIPLLTRHAEFLFQYFSLCLLDALFSSFYVVCLNFSGTHPSKLHPEVAAVYAWYLGTFI